uniref:Retrotransposon gag domain-containing protein n=1 Tax=Romanomermis culicivorax TaxID=13658 RepID=A0A915I6I2_ROMCU
MYHQNPDHRMMPYNSQYPNANHHHYSNNVRASESWRNQYNHNPSFKQHIHYNMPTPPTSMPALLAPLTNVAANMAKVSDAAVLPQPSTTVTLSKSINTTTMTCPRIISWDASAQSTHLLWIIQSAICEGDALTKFENILNSDDPPTTYAQLLQAMQLAFPSQWDSLHHRQILKDRKQKRTETVTAYFNELEKLGRLAYPNLDSNARNTFLESVFLEGLQTDVRRALKLKWFPDLKSLIDAATFVEQEILRDESNIIPCTAAKYATGQLARETKSIQAKPVGDRSTGYT